MKPSHLATPRQAIDGQWLDNANPIEHFKRDTKNQWRLIRVAAAVTLAAVVVLSCAPAYAQFMSTGKLAQHIQSEQESMRTQAGYYIVGVFDAYKDSQHCAPQSVTLEQLLPAVNAFVVSNPQLYGQPADHVLGYLFSRAWPCPSKNGRSV